MAVKKKQATKKTNISKKTKQPTRNVSDNKFHILNSELIRDHQFMEEFFLENLGFVNGKIQITNADSQEEVNSKVKAKAQLNAYKRTFKWVKEIEDNQKMYTKINNSGLSRANSMLIQLESDIKGAMKNNKELADAFRSQSYPNETKANNDPLVLSLETENKTFNEILKKIEKLK